MAGSVYGTLFQIMTWGESHGKGIGVTVDGCPAGLPLTEDIYSGIWTGADRDRDDSPPSARKGTRWRSFPAYLREKLRERP